MEVRAKEGIMGDVLNTQAYVTRKIKQNGNAFPCK